MTTTMRLTKSYFLRKNVRTLAQNLLGKYIFSLKDGQIAGGIITKVKACGERCNNSGQRENGISVPNEEMLKHESIVARVSLSEKREFVLYIVANVAGESNAVLICALQPTHGEELMLRRTERTQATPDLANTPAMVVNALGLSFADDGLPIPSDLLWLEDRDGTTS